MDGRRDEWKDGLMDGWTKSGSMDGYLKGMMDDEWNDG